MLKRKQGFVLMEILIGFMIFVFFLSAFLFGLMQLNKNLVFAQQKMHRQQEVKNKIETLKTLSYVQLKSLATAPGLTVKEIKPDLLEVVLTTLNEQWVWRLAR